MFSKSFPLIHLSDVGSGCSHSPLSSSMRVCSGLLLLLLPFLCISMQEHIIIGWVLTPFSSNFDMYSCMLFTTVADVLKALHHASVCEHVAGNVIVTNRVCIMCSLCL